MLCWDALRKNYPPREAKLPPLMYNLFICQKLTHYPTARLQNFFACKHSVVLISFHTVTARNFSIIFCNQFSQVFFCPRELIRFKLKMCSVVRMYAVLNFFTAGCPKIVTLCQAHTYLLVNLVQFVVKRNLGFDDSQMYKS